MIKNMKLVCSKCRIDLVPDNTYFLSNGDKTATVKTNCCGVNAVLKNDNWFRKMGRLCKHLLSR